MHDEGVDARRRSREKDSGVEAMCGRVQEGGGGTETVFCAPFLSRAPVGGPLDNAARFVFVCVCRLCSSCCFVRTSFLVLSPNGCKNSLFSASLSLSLCLSVCLSVCLDLTHVGFSPNPPPPPRRLQEAEKALHYIETIGPAQLVSQLLIALACTSGYVLSKAQTVKGGRDSPRPPCWREQSPRFNGSVRFQLCWHYSVPCCRFLP